MEKHHSRKFWQGFGDGEEEIEVSKEDIVNIRWRRDTGQVIVFVNDQIISIGEPSGVFPNEPEKLFKRYELEYKRRDNG